MQGHILVSYYEVEYTLKCRVRAAWSNKKLKFAQRNIIGLQKGLGYCREYP
jgi:hypothetical protein